jgi:hypothetical protein
MIAVALDAPGLTTFLTPLGAASYLPFRRTCPVTWTRSSSAVTFSEPVSESFAEETNHVIDYCLGPNPLLQTPTNNSFDSPCFVRIDDAPSCCLRLHRVCKRPDAALAIRQCRESGRPYALPLDWRLGARNNLPFRPDDLRSEPERRPYGVHLRIRTSCGCEQWYGSGLQRAVTVQLRPHLRVTRFLLSNIILPTTLKLFRSNGIRIGR